MAKWEYAAIIVDGTVQIGIHPSAVNVPRVLLVQPGNNLHYIVSWTMKDPSKNIAKVPIIQPWASPSSLEDSEKHWKKVFKDSAKAIQNAKANDASPRILYESTDVLHLVNLAGADGWEITGALGGFFVKTEHRMMRRQI